MNAYNILQKCSADNRANYYINQLVTNGYFDYEYGPKSYLERFDKFNPLLNMPSGTIRIYNDGFLENKHNRFDLKIAKSRGLLQFGYRKGAALRVEETGYGILISDKGFGYFDSKFAFET